MGKKKTIRTDSSFCLNEHEPCLSMTLDPTLSALPSVRDFQVGSLPTERKCLGLEIPIGARISATTTCRTNREENRCSSGKSGERQDSVPNRRSAFSCLIAACYDSGAASDSGPSSRRFYGV